VTDRPSPWWDPRRHQDRRGLLAARARILSAIRAWFADQGFVEADVGALALSPGAETHVQAFETAGLYLHTSPEFAMKKLLAAGEEKIFFLGKVYRAGERGPLHAPEFTMLEWYRAHAPYEQVMDDCVAIARAASHAIGIDHWRREMHGALRSLTLHNPIRQTTADAFCDLAGVDLLSTIDLAGQGDREGLAAQLRSQSDAESRASTPLRVSPDDGWSDIFSKVLTSRIEPALGRDSLTFLCEYPIVEAALARPCAHDPRVAERFELYAFGLELANGYGELTNPAEQRRRLQAAMDEKDRRYGVRWPVDEDFLAALGQMPPASGCALGVDRLIMLMTGASHIDQVLWNPLPSVE
jgi:lysyl-tRNA synthetase class 2